MEAAPRSPGASEHLRSTQAPLAWQIALAAGAAIAIASYAAYALGFQPGTLIQDLHRSSIGNRYEVQYELIVIAKVIPAGLIAMFVVVAGISAPKSRQSLVATIATGLMCVAAMFLGWATFKEPILAGLAMAAVMALTALAARQSGPIYSMGMLLNVVYFFYGAFGLLNHLDALDLVKLAGIGFGAAVLVLVLAHFIRAAFGRHMHAALPPPRPSDAGASFFAGGPTMRYALMRGLLLGVLMAVYASDKNQNVFWIFLTIWVTFLPVAETTRDRAIRRVAGVMVGCLLVASLAQVMPAALIIWIGIAATLVGTMWIWRNYAIWEASVTFLVIALFGDLHRDRFVDWAGKRLLDTIIGVAIAIIAYGLAVRLPAYLGKDKSSTAA
jgi:uncharacterized membrane protein YccC